MTPISLTALRSQLFKIVDRVIDLKISDYPLNNIIEKALKVSWTRDVFDRLSVAETMRDQSLLLITADKKIREKFTQALW